MNLSSTCEPGQNELMPLNRQSPVRNNFSVSRFPSFHVRSILIKDKLYNLFTFARIVIVKR